MNNAGAVRPVKSAETAANWAMITANRVLFHDALRGPRFFMQHVDSDAN